MPQTDDELELLCVRAVNRPETLSETERKRILEAVGTGTELDIVHTLTSLAEHDPSVIDEIVIHLKSLLRVDDDLKRGEATLVFATLARRHPERITAVATEAVELLTDESAAVRNQAVQLLARLVGVNPDLAVPAASYVARFVGSNAPILRLSGLEIVHAIARTEPEQATALVTDLVDIVDESTEQSDDEQINNAIKEPFRGRGARTKRRQDNVEWQREQARARAAQTLAVLAQERPEALMTTTSQLAAVLESDDHPIVLGELADAIVAVAREHNMAGREVIDPLGMALGRLKDKETNARIAVALSVLADRHGAAVTESVRPSLPTVFELLRADRPAIRGATMSLLVVVSNYQPDAVKSVLETIRGLFADQNPVVRGGAAWVLSAAGTPDDRDLLISLRENDSNADVREAADQALAEINDRIDENATDSP
ncbi:HEAT repeat domain-containing protein [Haladaptatus halobius]|uniref:HEAT repeat domain-containing protein n=1 Tax=Haladaptatus halobius TaxID=2884875 RepID=UPI001D0AF936|nr:HEAT repeat domain-containing protein [Haladaptatus halobius]